MLQSVIHYSMHLLLPGVIAFVFFKDQWKKAYLIMLATMLVDLDHVFACTHMFPDEGSFVFLGLDHLFSCNEIFAADRCSIGFHPLHSYLAIGIYVLMMCFQKTRIVGLGLVLHMLSDFQDCFWM